MKAKCPHFLIKNSVKLTASDSSLDPRMRLIIRHGRYYRASDSRWIDRFFCKSCERYFSRATYQPSYGQKKRRVNSSINTLLCSGVSQRRVAIILGINRKTVARKLYFLSNIARLKQQARLEEFKASPISYIQWDDLETSEHSKCKPLSVALAVEPKSRKILGFQVSQMPAKGLLAKIAYRKYGYRKDERAKGWNDLFLSLKPIVAPDAVFLSDENPHYPKALKRHFSEAIHKTTKGRRGCVAGQGELKKIGFDPLFSLNHTCAMLRANLNRLFRRTWCTTKKREALIAHLTIYVEYHNSKLTSGYTNSVGGQFSTVYFSTNGCAVIDHDHSKNRMIALERRRIFHLDHESRKSLTVSNSHAS